MFSPQWVISGSSKVRSCGLVLVCNRAAAPGAAGEPPSVGGLTCWAGKVSSRFTMYVPLLCMLTPGVSTVAFSKLSGAGPAAAPVDSLTPYCPLPPPCAPSKKWGDSMSTGRGWPAPYRQRSGPRVTHSWWSQAVSQCVPRGGHR